MKTILLFGAGKSASVLIRTLLEMAAALNWHILIADKNLSLIEEKTDGSPFATPLAVDVTESREREKAIRSADLVISLLPPSLHYLVARDCLVHGKDLLTASYADAQILALDQDVRARGLIFLCEMGLDPGIDHMSAMRLIERIRSKGGRITRFLSHCGGLVSPESDDNPWHYKISWNPANVVSAGTAGAVFKQDGQIRSLNHSAVFSGTDYLDFPGLGRWQCYPNRDSLPYISLYGLEEAQTFIRTTIRHPDFMRGWSAIVQAGLTAAPLDSAADTYAQWSKAILPLLNEGNAVQIRYLGLLDEEPINPEATSSAQVLQHLLETRLAMQPKDKDLVLMVHQIEYELGDERRLAESSLQLEGFDATLTAMATTVGLPLAHAARFLLEDRPATSGVLLPITPLIYERILPALEADGIVFQETDVLIS